MRSFLTVFVMISATAFLGACKSISSHSLKYLDQYVGKVPSAVGLWDTEPLHSQLKELMGDRYEAFVRDMKAGGPLTRDKYLYSVAYIEQDSSKGYAFILVDTDNNKVQAAIQTNTEIQTFQSPGEVFLIPKSIENKLDSL